MIECLVRFQQMIIMKINLYYYDTYQIFFSNINIHLIIVKYKDYLSYINEFFCLPTVFAALLISVYQLIL